MRIRNDEQSRFDPSGTQGPMMFYGTIDPVASGTFLDAPLMSLYWNITSGSQAMFIKTANNKAAADWVKMFFSGATISSLSLTGDLTVSGTVTAGDVVATNA
jgi:hypothetical protein